MTRHTFAGTAADFIVQTSVGGLLRLDLSERLTFWSAETGGAQYQVSHPDTPGTLLSEVTVTGGFIPLLLGPDGVTQMWVQVESTGKRRFVIARQDIAIAAKVDKTEIAVRPEFFGAIGDGTTDDTAAVQAAIDAAEQEATTHGERWRFAIVQGNGRSSYAISSTLTVQYGFAELGGVKLRDLHLTGLPGLAGDPLLRTQGRYVFIEDCTFDPDFNGAGVRISEHRAEMWRCVVGNFTGYGIWCDGQAGTAVINECVVRERQNSEPESAFAADALVVDRSDVELNNTHLQWSKRLLVLTPNTSAFWCRGGHLVNDAAPTQTPRVDPILVEVQQGAADATFLGTYFDNGHVDLHSYEVSLLDCAYVKNNKVTMSEVVRVFANQASTPSPKRLRMDGVVKQSPDLEGGTTDLLRFLPDGSNAWADPGGLGVIESRLNSSFERYPTLAGEGNELLRTRPGPVLTLATVAAAAVMEFQVEGVTDSPFIGNAYGNPDDLQINVGNGQTWVFRTTGAMSPPTVPDVTGSRNGNAALADLLTSLESLGFITDSTTA